jgi:hypothetical protein
MIVSGLRRASFGPSSWPGAVESKSHPGTSLLSFCAGIVDFKLQIVEHTGEPVRQIVVVLLN